MILLHWFTGWLSAYTAKLLQKVTLTFPASHQTLVKSLCSRLAEPRGQQSSFQPASQCEWVRQNRGGWLGKGCRLTTAFHQFIMEEPQMPQILRSALDNSDDTIVSFSFVPGLPHRPVGQGFSITFTIRHKESDMEIRLTRKYVQMSSNENKATALIVVKIRYPVITSGKEQSTF